MKFDCIDISKEKENNIVEPMEEQKETDFLKNQLQVKIVNKTVKELFNEVNLVEVVEGILSYADDVKDLTGKGLLKYFEIFEEVKNCKKQNEENLEDDKNKEDLFLDIIKRQGKNNFVLGLCFFNEKGEKKHLAVDKKDIPYTKISKDVFKQFTESEIVGIITCYLSRQDSVVDWIDPIFSTFEFALSNKEKLNEFKSKCEEKLINLKERYDL